MIKKFLIASVVALISVLVLAHPDPSHDCLTVEDMYACTYPEPTAIPTATPIPASTEQTELLDMLMEITVAPESSCSYYDRDDYEHGVSGTKERSMAEGLGWVLPYSNVKIDANDLYGRYGTQIEHIVAAKEAHDSGMGCKSVNARHTFGRDSSNLTLALPAVNRAKSAKDLAEWLPEYNVCWFVATVVRQKHEWNLKMDGDEWDVAHREIQSCSNFELS